MIYQPDWVMKNGVAANLLGIFPGAILLVAGVLKGYDLLANARPEFGLSSTTPLGLVVAAIGVELIAGLWLVSGMGQRAARIAGMICFAVFACVSLFWAVNGEVSCGCFGRMHLNPWWSFSLDLFAATLLWTCRPGKLKDRAGSQRRSIALASAVILGSIAIWIFWGHGSHWAPFANTVVLEPRTWVGKPFPLVDDITDGKRLLRGNWLVVFYRHDCPRCQRAIERYEPIDERSHQDPEGYRVLFVEVPPYGPSARSPRMRSRLTDRQEWFIVTPTELRISNGQTVAVSSGDEDAFAIK
jgi:hypothetical protein